MPTTLLLKGHCTAWKNGAIQDAFSCQFMHDVDLSVFKIVSGGTIIFTFRANQTTGWDSRVVGLIAKKQATRVGVKLQTGDEYIFEFESSDMNTGQRIIQTLSQTRAREQAGTQIIALLKTRDRVKIADLCSILTQNGLPNSFEDGRSYVEYAISTNQVQGVVDGQEFVSKLAMESQSVRYDIVAKFEMNESGAIIFKCPNCGAALPLMGKESTGKCKYCGSSYAIPRKLLDAI